MIEANPTFEVADQLPPKWTQIKFTTRMCELTLSLNQLLESPTNSRQAVTAERYSRAFELVLLFSLSTGQSKKQAVCGRVGNELSGCSELNVLERAKRSERSFEMDKSHHPSSRFASSINWSIAISGRLKSLTSPNPVFFSPFSRASASSLSSAISRTIRPPM